MMYEWRNDDTDYSNDDKPDSEDVPEPLGLKYKLTEDDGFRGIELWVYSLLNVAAPLVDLQIGHQNLISKDFTITTREQFNTEEFNDIKLTQSRE